MTSQENDTERDNNTAHFSTRNSTFLSAICIVDSACSYCSGSLKIIYWLLLDLAKPVVSVVQEEWKGGETLRGHFKPFLSEALPEFLFII